MATAAHLLSLVDGRRGGGCFRCEVSRPGLERCLRPALALQREVRLLHLVDRAVAPADRLAELLFLVALGAAAGGRIGALRVEQEVSVGRIGAES